MLAICFIKGHIDNNKKKKKKKKNVINSIMKICKYVVLLQQELYNYTLIS